VLAKVEAALPAAFDIKYVFNRFTLGEAFCKERLGLADTQLNDPRLRDPAPPRASHARRSRRPTSSAAGP
jgi:hypothetical protein